MTDKIRHPDVVPTEAELHRLRHEVAAGVGTLRRWQRANMALRAEVERLRAALKAIANIDYRGNRSAESDMAARAITHSGPAHTEVSTNGDERR